ncbi:hypothetical protein ABIB25_001168 [Nakamurella sp. UYEF19]|uniref:DUF3349 domain-containing protein n=1 Tax=Nakamurella sp. UYEF19 TaxID=1756392 RepID=UPI0033935292
MAADVSAEKGGLISSVLHWLRKGYPEGVPPKDYFPLIALLRRRLDDAELDQIVEYLTSNGGVTADRADVMAAIEKVANEDPTDEDVALVAARLAAAGWPLAGALDRSPSVQVKTSMERPALLTSILGWLRAGYPQGVPAKDYIPLLALLRRRLSDDETVWIAREIVESGHAPVGASDIGVLITKVTDEMPSESDINRVREHLEAAGWPVLPGA